MKRTKSIYLALVAILLSPMVANADLITHQDFGGFNTSRGPGSAPMGRLTVDNAISISSFGVLADINGNSDMQFLIFDANTGANLFASAVTSFVDVGLDYYFSDSLSCTFNPGMFYSVGASNSNGASYAVDFVANSISGFNFFTGNQNLIGSFGANTLFTSLACCDVMTAFNTATKVPEPGTLALLCLGLVFMAVRRRKTV